MANVPGVGEVATYFRTEYVDDLTGKPAEDIETIRFAAPSKAEDEDSGETYIGLDHYEIDLASASFDKLVKALTPYVSVARKTVPRANHQLAIKGPNPALTEWNRRAKEWARKHGHEVADRGRLSPKIADLYARNNPDDPRPA
nr:Lsr2 family protein [Streptomyces sp. SID3212]